MTPSTSDYLWIYIAPFILTTGICGNTLVLAVMSQSRMRGTSTCVYLLTMAIADLFAVVTGVVPDWLTAQGIVTIKETHPLLCKTEKFLSYTSADTSIWACVAFTVDRFVAVCFPMDSARLCPPQNARFYAVAVFVTAVAKNLHVFATRGQELMKVDNATTAVRSNCGYPYPEYGDFERYVRPWIAFGVVNLGPFVVIVFCNLFIVRAMARLRRSRRKSAVIVSAKDSNTAIQMAVLSLSASICFLVCVTPSMILLIGRPYWQYDPRYVVAKAVGNLVYYVNHSLNFFLYCITGAKFRAELKSLFSRTVPATGAVRTSISRISNNLMVFANRPHQKDPPNGDTSSSSRYASEPCISRLMGDGTDLRGSDCERPFPGEQLRPGAIGDRTKAASDAMLLESFGRGGK